MPLERVSQGFKDISATFQINPLNSDLIALKNENAISRSIRNLVLTTPGDIPFSPEIGCFVSRSLFDNFVEITASNIKREIESTIRRFEPRVKLKKDIDGTDNGVVVTANFDNNEYDVVINYFVIGVDIPVQQLSFILLPTR